MRFHEKDGRIGCLVWPLVAAKWGCANYLSYIDSGKAKTS